MKRTGGILTLGVAAVMLAGCGGSGANTYAANSYRGAWSGNWTSTTLNDGGVATWTVAPDGSITGTITLLSNNATANCVGTVDANGNFRVLAGFGTYGNFDLQGTFTLAAPNINGTYTTYWQSTGYQTNVTLRPVSASGG